MRVNWEGKIYTFDPKKQSRDSLLNHIAERLPIPMKWRIWLTIQAIKRKGILIEDKKED